VHKKTDIQELDIPKDDIECWERYPKHHWVYDLSRLLDVQNVSWSPYEVDSMPDREINIRLISDKSNTRQPGFIYLKKPEGRHIITEVYITKGEIKLMRHIDPTSHLEMETLFGELELRLNSFVTRYFQKFTGVISVETLGNVMARIRLCGESDINRETNQEVVKLIKRIYKKSELTLSGPSDRILQETIAS